MRLQRCHISRVEVERVWNTEKVDEVVVIEVVVGLPPSMI